MSNSNLNTADPKNNSVIKASEDSKANLAPTTPDSSKVREALLNNLAIGSGSYAKEMAKTRSKILALENNLSVALNRLAEIDNDLKNSGKLAVDGVVFSLSSFEKKSLRSDKRRFKKAITEFRFQISELNKSYTALNQADSKKERRTTIRKSAAKEIYHKLYGDAVKKGISKEIEGMDANSRAELAVKLEALSAKEADALLMKAILKAPYFLHTKVVANAEHRRQYLNHFRDELGISQPQETNN